MDERPRIAGYCRILPRSGACGKFGARRLRRLAYESRNNRRNRIVLVPPFHAFSRLFTAIGRKKSAAQWNARPHPGPLPPGEGETISALVAWSDLRVQICVSRVWRGSRLTSSCKWLISSLSVGKSRILSDSVALGRKENVWTSTKRCLPSMGLLRGFRRKWLISRISSA